jgi:putative copper resistance protein D
METILVTVRWTEFVASMALFGALSFRLYFRAGFAKAPELRKEFDRWLKPVLVVAAAFALASSVAWLDLEAAMMGNGWADALNIGTVSTVLFQTVFGSAWVWHLTFAAVALALVLSVQRGFHNGAQNILLISLAAALVASSAWAGHAVARSGVAGPILLAMQVIHLLAAAAWLGSLPALGYVVYKAQGDREGAWRAIAQDVLPQYSQAGYAAVALILLTGSVNSWFLVGSVHALFSTNYGRVLVTKVCLVAVMVGLALLNRFGIAPAVIGPDPDGRTAAKPFKALWRSVTAEFLLGLAVLAAVSVLGTLPPAIAG